MNGKHEALLPQVYVTVLHCKVCHGKEWVLFADQLLWAQNHKQKNQHEAEQADDRATVSPKVLLLLESEVDLFTKNVHILEMPADGPTTFLSFTFAHVAQFLFKF